MREIDTLVSRLPRHELAMRRLYVADPTFRTICGDYDEALRALRYWQAEGTDCGCRIEQYRELLDDLESEILNKIEAAARSDQNIWIGPKG